VVDQAAAEAGGAAAGEESLGLRAGRDGVDVDGLPAGAQVEEEREQEARGGYTEVLEGEAGEGGAAGEGGGEKDAQAGESDR